MDDGGLFPLDPAWMPALPDTEPGERVSAGRRLTMRHMAMLTRGRHPLTRAPLHPEAAPVDDPKADGRRCGNCRFRVTRLWGDVAGTYPKCRWGWDGSHKTDPPRATRGAATDCRGWWPACLDHEPVPDDPAPEEP